jgi:hypothetical protein
MDDRRALLVVTALAEGATGLCLLALPGLAFDLLLGPAPHPAESLFVGRFAAAALVGIGVASWLAGRGGQALASAGLLGGLTVYNVAAALLLAYGGAVLKLTGILLWPAAVAHAGLALWCAAGLRRPPPARASPTQPP